MLFSNSINFQKLTTCNPFYVGHLVISLCKRTVHSDPSFKPKNVVLLVKTSRYEYEKKRNPNRTENELKKFLSSNGSDYEGLLARFNQHYSRVKDLKQSLLDRNIEVKIVDRSQYNQEVIDWADAIFSAGGDGTFLLAASKIFDKKKPLIGINTDPVRSEGFLCLPKRCSSNIPAALDALLGGKFRWLWRQRIRITTSGKHPGDDPVELHDLMFQSPEYRFVEHVKEHEEVTTVGTTAANRPARVLPVRALNEVFIGESLSARASYYEMSVDDGAPLKQKSSGVTICTGTGSFSWHFHINHLTPDCIAEVLSIAQRLHPQCKLPLLDADFLQKVHHQHQMSLCFDPQETKMAFTVRDPVKNDPYKRQLLHDHPDEFLTTPGVFHVRHPRGFANQITIRSRMWDAHLVVDGGSSFIFNDGAVAKFEIHPEDALCCVELSNT